MPALVAWLVSTLLAAAGQFFFRVLFAAGLAVATNKFLLPPARALLAGYASNLPSTAYQLFGYMGIDRGLTLILSAYAVARVARVALTRKSAS